MKHHQRIRAAIFERADVGLVISAYRLPNDPDTLGFEIGNRAVLTETINREDLID
jgi:hypothetical protein